MQLTSRSSAVQEGKLVRALLNKPKGWRIKVWENLGWHVMLRKYGMCLHWYRYGGPREFFTLLDSSGTGPGGEIYWTERFHSINPNTAIRRQLKIANDFVKQCTKAIQEVER